MQYRGASYAPDVLAFPLSDAVSDIVIVPARARERAQEFGLSYLDMLSYLFIHAALHIHGYTHGPAMDAAERRLLRRLTVPLPTHLRPKRWINSALS
jgi:rRNA maturation RNase YbeY